jgi:hypothetical protein
VAWWRFNERREEREICEHNKQYLEGVMVTNFRKIVIL